MAEGRGLSVMEAIGVATVLEECVHKLHIIGDTMSVPPPKSFLEQTPTELYFNDDAEHRKARRDAAKGAEASGLRQEILNYVIPNPYRPKPPSHPHSQEALKKVQEDRADLEDVLLETMTDLAYNRNFDTLKDAVYRAKKRNEVLKDIIHDEIQGRKRTRKLKKRLADVEKEREIQLEHRQELISHFKNQVQEMRSKTAKEELLHSSKCATSIQQTQRRCFLAEKKLEDQLRELRERKREENRAHEDTVQYFDLHITDLQNRYELWTEKYERDSKQLRLDVETLKTSKAKNLEKLMKLAKTYGEYKQVAIEDRALKERARRQEQQEVNELRACIKMQAWWRGVQVRKGFGPFKVSKKKGKKNKKDSKDKKKK